MRGLIARVFAPWVEVYESNLDLLAGSVATCIVMQDTLQRLDGLRDESDLLTAYGKIWQHPSEGEYDIAKGIKTKDWDRYAEMVRVHLENGNSQNKPHVHFLRATNAGKLSYCLDYNR